MEGLAYYSSPVTDIKITSSEKGITEVLFTNEERLPENPNLLTEQCIQELDEYFHRGRKFFTVELDLKGTEFQKRVWTELISIPFGSTVSYEELALRLGDLKAIRAVAAANGANPVAIIVPCHRVIGKNGELTGYAGGLANKEWLLYHEGSLLRQLNLFTTPQ